MDLSPSLLPEISAFLRRGKNVKKLPVPTIAELPDELRSVAEGLPGITGSWNPVEIYTADPKNLLEEKLKFLHAFKRDRVYQPVLRYGYAEGFSLGDARKKLGTMLDAVRACATKTRATKLMKLMFYYKLKDDLATCDLVEGIQKKDDLLVRDALQYKYPGVDPLILSIAETDVSRRIGHDEKTEVGELSTEEKEYLHGLSFTAQSFKEAFEWALDQYGILRKDSASHGYRVIIDRRSTAIDVRDKSVEGPAVFIPETCRENGYRMLGLMAHEIEGHARQSWNGEKLFVFGGGPLKIDEETLYEGLAMRHEIDFRERYFGIETPTYNPDYYVFAVHAAEHGGTFYDVFKQQLEMRLKMMLKIPLHSDFSHTQIKDAEVLDRAMQRAWGTTYRVMRGHTNMENPLHFAMAKDLAYFRGWVLDNQLRTHGHGHINEASVCSIGQLRVLAEFDIKEDQLAAPFKNVTEQYMKMLLGKRSTGGAFAAKRR